MLEVSDTGAPWVALLRHAYSLIDAAVLVGDIPWSLGGGTVLMFRLQHRSSKDVDIFLQDRQHLGLFSPRIQDETPSECVDYVESSSAVKLYYGAGEVDFVASATLTNNPFERARVLGREIWLETPAEIVAKKLWHRGASATARDLFDLAAVADAGLDVGQLAPALRKSGGQFVAQLHQRRDILEPQFEAIDALQYHETYDHCLRIATTLVSSAQR